MKMRRLDGKLRGSLGKRRCWLGGWGRGDGEMLRKDQRWDDSRCQRQRNLAPGWMCSGRESGMNQG